MKTRTERTRRARGSAATAAALTLAISLPVAAAPAQQPPDLPPVVPERAAPAVVAPDPPTPEPTAAAVIQAAEDEQPSPGPSRRPKDPRQARPVPTWMWVGLGVSTGLGLASLGLAIGSFVQVRPGGRIQNDIDAAVQESLTNDDDVDDVTAMQGVTESCDIANLPGESLPGGAQTIRNKKVADLCKTGEAYETMNKAGWGMFAVSTVSAAAFGVAIAVVATRRARPSTRARRWTPLWTAGPRGVSVGARVRF